MDYNPTTKTWSKLPPPPDLKGSGELSDSAAATGPKGLIYHLGGGSSDMSEIWTPRGELEGLSLSAKTWTVEASMPTPRGMLAAATGPDGRIYALGGLANDGNLGTSTAIVEAYVPSLNSWTTAPSMQQARTNFAAVIGPDHRLYAIGGEYVNFNTGCCQLLASVEAFSFTTHTWTYVAPLPTAAMIAGAVVGADGRIYAVGQEIGYGANGPQGLWAYDVKTNSWTTLTAPPVAGVATGVGTNKSIVVVGPETSSSRPSNGPTYIYAT